MTKVESDLGSKAYSGPSQNAFTVRVPSRADQKNTSHVLVPFITLGTVILLSVFLVPVIRASASSDVYVAVTFGIVVVVFGLAIWAALRFLAYAKQQSVFRDEFLAALEGAGFSWGKKDLQVMPVNYTGGSYLPLKDSSHETSKWNVTWSGEIATLTPLPSEV